MNINSWLEKNKKKFINTRRYFHQHPEVGFKEHKTSKYLKKILNNSGYKIYQNKIMQTGFYVEYGSSDSPILAIRTDIDALPISDLKKVSYSSKNNGFMHACGHDAHMTIAIGVALWLKENAISISGKVRFIFQPAEEIAPGGAIEMIKGDAIKSVDHIIGYHVLPTLDSKSVAINQKYVNAAVEIHSFNLKGRGGHTSRPEETDDLITIGSDFIMKINEKMNQIKTNTPFVFTFGHVKSGYTFNVIPNDFLIEGTFRYLDPKIKQIVYKTIKNLIKDFKNNYNININHETPYACPPVINDKYIVDIVKESSVDILNKKNVIDLKKTSMGGEDFSYYLDHCPGAYFRIGSYDGNVKDLHTPHFDINEECIFTGIKVLCKTIKKYYKLV